jgi:glycosyltransferase involved in cell wall biosynthesis
VSGDESLSTDSRNKITVVIPTFNRRVQLQKAVESVLQERRVPIEVHIFDNASTDQTESYVRDLVANDPRVSYLRRPENIGSTANYQHGLGTVSTAYFVPLADDDWLLPDFLHDAYRILETYVEVGAAIFVAEVRDADGVLHGTYPAPLEQLHFGLLRQREHFVDWLQHGHYVWSSILWRRETLACLGAPYLCTGLPSDVDFQAQIFCRYPVYLCNRPGAVFFVHADQASRGFTTSDIASWNLLFERLDCEINRNQILSSEEYLPLRAIAEKRYRGAWSAHSGMGGLPDRERIVAASAAGFRLGDWDTAFSLIDRPPSQSQTAGSSVFRLPAIGRTASTESAGIADSASELLGHVVGWMKQATHAVHQLERDIDQLAHDKDEARVQLSGEIDHLQWQRNELELELSRSKSREAEALTRFELAESRRVELAQRLQSLRSHPLAKIAMKLGLHRFFQ